MSREDRPVPEDGAESAGPAADATLTPGTTGPSGPPAPAQDPVPTDRTDRQDQDMRDAGLFTILTGASRLLGLLRSYAMARVLGGTLGADAFWAAFKLVNFFRLFLGEGAVGHALMPVLQDLEVRNRSEARELAARAVRLTLLLCLVLTGVLLVCLEPLLRLYVPDLPEAGHRLTARLTWWMSPYLACIGVASVLMTPLQALRVFLPTAAHPLLFNLAILALALVTSWFPTPTMAFAAGVVLGGFLQAGWLAWAAARRGIPLFHPGPLGLRDPHLGEVVRLTVPTLAGVFLMRVNTVIDVRFASGLATGSLSCLNYAFLIHTAVLGLTGVGVATVYFSALAEAHARGDEAGFGVALRDGLGLTLVVGMPITVLGTVFPESLAGLFKGGAFGNREVALTASALAGYSPGLALGGVFQLLSRALYAKKLQGVVVRGGIVAVAVNVALAYAWVGPYQVGGLAAAASVALLVHVLWLAWSLRHDLVRCGAGLPAVRLTLLSVLAAVPVGLLPEAARTSPLVAPPLLGGVYLALLYGGGFPESALLTRMLTRRGRRGPP